MFLQRELEGHYGDVYTCKFFPSGIVVLSGGSDMQLKIWSAETGQCATTLLGHTAGKKGSVFVVFSHVLCGVLHVEQSDLGPYLFAFKIKLTCS